MRVAEDVIVQQREMTFELRCGVQVGCRVIEISTAKRSQRGVFPRPQLVERARRFIRRIRAFEGGGRVRGFHQNHRNRKHLVSQKHYHGFDKLGTTLSSVEGSWPGLD